MPTIGLIKNSLRSKRFRLVSHGNACYAGYIKNYHLFVLPPKFCTLSIVFNFPWDLLSPESKLKTMLMQILEGLNRKVLWYFLDITYQVGDWLRAQWIFRHSKTITTNDDHMFPRVSKSPSHTLKVNRIPVNFVLSKNDEYQTRL